MPKPTLDFETYSEAGFVWNEPGSNPKKPMGYWSALPGAPQGKKGLPIVGASVYTEHDTAEVLSAHYDLCDGRGVRRWHPGDPPPLDLFAFIAAGGFVDAHNAMFEYLVWSNICVPKYGWPPLDELRFPLRCTMATARTNNLPGALEKLGDALGLDVKKDKEGKRLLDRFSKPRNPTKSDPRLRILPADDPDGPRLFDYGDQDVRAEQSAADSMPEMSAAEEAFWLIDQEINRRGLGVDRQGIRDCIAVLEQAHEQYGLEHEQLTGGLQPGQLAEVRGFLRGFGVNLPDMQADTIDDALANPVKYLGPRPDGVPVPPAMHPTARRVLEIRTLLGSASVKKLFAMEYQANRANRLQNLIVHHGARTGRPTGEGPQPLNLPKAGPPLVECGSCGRPHRPDVDACVWCGVPAPPVERKGKWRPDYVDALLSIMAHRSLALVEWYFGDALLAIQGCVRGLFQAAEGYELIASDYSAIEAVVAAMISGEQWRIDAFRAKRDIYLMSASRITGAPYEQYLSYADQHGENHPDRQDIGKVAELACLSPLTQVLTNRGLVDMGDVRLSDKLWDGEEWVKHAGLVERGRKRTLILDGVEMTPDHKVICGGLWKEARQLVSSESFRSLALASGSANLPFWARRPHLKMPPSRCVATVGRAHTRLHGRTFAKGAVRLAAVAPKRRLRRTERTTGAMPILSPTTHTAGACLIEFPLASLGATPSTRGKGGIAITPAGGFRFSPSGGTERKDGGRSYPTSSRFRAGIIPRSKWTASNRTVTMNRATCVSRPDQRGKSAQSATCRRLSTTTRRVCDIALAGPRNRFTIKTASGWMIVHNCGYGGWEGAWRAFDPAEADKSSDEVCGVVRAWRNASPQIVAHWGGQRRYVPGQGWRDELFGIEGAVIAAIQNPGQVYTPQVPSSGEIAPWPVDLQFAVLDDILRMILPSDREIKYWNPRVAPSSKRPGTLEISYMTWNTNPKYGALGWVRMSTWGSRVYENADQAIAHDILRFAIVNLRAAGYPCVLHVYDEIVCEVPAGAGSIEQFETIMATLPPWAAGWPIRAAGGWRGKRYRKG